MQKISNKLEVYNQNFTNKYTEDASELKKPSKEIARAIEAHTKANLYNVVVAKTDASHVIIFLM